MLEIKSTDVKEPGMKKIFVLLTALVISLSLIGCDKNSTQNNTNSKSQTIKTNSNSMNDKSSTKDANNNTEENNDFKSLDTDNNNTIQFKKDIYKLASDKSRSYTIVEKNLALKDYKGELNVKYPVFEGKNANIKQLNDAIFKIVNSNVLKEDEDTTIDTSINYTVQNASDSYVSILFTCFSNSATAAHPLKIWFTINYDLKENRILLLNDVTEVNKGLLQKSKGAMKNQLDKGTYEAILSTNYNIEELLHLLKSDSAEFYYKNDNLYIGFAVIGAGDYTYFASFKYM